MPTLRQIIDKERPVSPFDVQAYGTSEGVEKAWDTRGRGNRAAQEGCLGVNCDKLADIKDVTAPHIDNIELMLSSNKDGENINFTKEALRQVLQHALDQLADEGGENHTISFVNSPSARNIDHFVTVQFHRKDVIQTASED